MIKEGQLESKRLVRTGPVHRLAIAYACLLSLEPVTARACIFFSASLFYEQKL